MKSFTLFKLLIFGIVFYACNNEKTILNEEVSDLQEPSIIDVENASSNVVNSLANETNASSISVYDGLIVFNFAEEYTTGQFANGDYWVHNNGNSVVINEINPASTTVSSRVINGTMINPKVSIEQGYDSNPRDMVYKSSLNVDPGIAGNSLTIPANTSVVKSISMESDAGRPIIKDAVVLTVLSETPPDGAFRPPYTGDDKNIIATVNDLNYSVLGGYPRLGNEPDILDVQDNFERVWLEHHTDWHQRDIHPDNNMPAYGRDVSQVSGNGLVLLQLDYTQAEKETLLIRLVQYGLDIYGVAKNGGVWYNNGGHNQGRKMPLVLSAKVLNNENILAYADKEQYFIFADDQQHFYVTQAEVDFTNSAAWDPDTRGGTTPYTVEDIGIADWSQRHTDRPSFDNADWGAYYRHVNGPAQFTQILAANLMNVQADWNWPPVFDYFDRYYENEKTNRVSGYTGDLWEAYVFDSGVLSVPDYN